MDFAASQGVTSARNIAMDYTAPAAGSKLVKGCKHKASTYGTQYQKDFDTAATAAGIAGICSFAEFMQHIVSNTAINNNLYKLENLWTLTPDHHYIASELPTYTKNSKKGTPPVISPIAIAVHPSSLSPKDFPAVTSTSKYPYPDVIEAVTTHGVNAKNAGTATTAGAATILAELPRMKESLRLVVGTRNADGAQFKEPYIKSMAGTMTPYYMTKSVPVLKDATLADTAANHAVPSYDTPDYDATLLAAAGSSADTDVDKAAFKSQIDNYGAAAAPDGASAEEKARAAIAKLHIDTITKWDSCGPILGC